MKESMLKLFKMFFSFKGRLNRQRYFFYPFAPAAVLLVNYLVINAILDSTMSDTSMVIFSAISIGVSIICAISGLSISARRLHDLNLPGFLALVFLLDLIPIPIIDLLLLIAGLFILFKKGTDGDNDYGPDPLYIDDLYAPNI